MESVLYFKELNALSKFLFGMLGRRMIDEGTNYYY